MSSTSLLNKLAPIVGDENALDGGESPDSFSTGGIRPGVVLFPGSVGQISEIMKLASRESLTVIPMGSGTKRSLGNTPRSADIVLSTRRLNNIIEHESADLVATAECGITLTELEAALGVKNQFLPIDPPHTAEGATVGGVIASNDSGPMRLRYGTCRELLIGMKVVRADGTDFRGGSKVVKNVAGYDLPKLFTGSLGTLGIIVEATFRLYPVPESSMTCLARFDSLEDSHSAVRSLLDSDLVMTSLEHVTPPLAGFISRRSGLGMKGSGYHLAVRVMNVAGAVRDQVNLIMRLLGGSGTAGPVVEGEDEKALWREIRDFPWNLPEEGRTVLKSGVLINGVPGLFRMLEKLSAGHGIRAYASARAGNGAVVISLECDDDTAVSVLDHLRDYCRSADGSLVIIQSSERVKASVGVWGDLGTGFGIMKRIKSSFDPLNILNPGRIF